MCAWHYGPWVRQPLRVVLDPALIVRAEPQKYSRAAGRWCSLRRAAARRRSAARCASSGCRRRGRRLDLAAVVERLTAREVNELLVECGPRLAARFLAANLVDELILYVAPILLGADAAPLAALRGLARALMRCRHSSSRGQRRWARTCG